MEEKYLNAHKIQCFAAPEIAALNGKTKTGGVKKKIDDQNN